MCLYMFTALVGSYCLCIFFQISESVHCSILWFLVQVGCIGFYIFCTEPPLHSKSIVNLRIDENDYCWDDYFLSYQIYAIVSASLSLCLVLKNCALCHVTGLSRFNKRETSCSNCPRFSPLPLTLLLHLIDAWMLLVKIWVHVFPIENEVISPGS